MSFKWRKAREILSTPIHKSATDWPGALVPEDLAALQFPQCDDDQKALLGCIRDAVRRGDIQTIPITTRCDCLPGRRPPTVSSNLREYLREVDAGRQSVEVKAIEAEAFSALLSCNGIDEPSEHVAAWFRRMGSIPAAKSRSSEPASEDVGQAVKEGPRKKNDGLSHAIDAGLIGYCKKHGTDPTDRALFDWLADHDDTGIIIELDRDADKITWRRQDGGLSDTSFKSFQHRMTGKRRK